VPDFDAAKGSLRATLLAARSALAPGIRAEASQAIADRLWALPRFQEGRIVALYASVGAEVETLVIARRALEAGKRVLWPLAAEGPDRSLRFAACPPEALRPGPLGAPEPPPGSPAVSLEALDCVLVPGVAFDGQCRRLGRGGGYYDATLAGLPERTFRVGLCFEIQVVEAVPVDPHDVRLHAVVTERQVLTAPPGRAPMRAL
jgi:5-formyltetrahydrofolate cyclo-ligase